MSYNPATGLVYIPAQHAPQGYHDDMTELEKRKVIGFNHGTSITGTLLPDDKAAFKAASAALTGRLVAFDPRAGKVAWAVDYPAAWNGGTMTTAGNLVFQGTSTGASAPMLPIPASNCSTLTCNRAFSVAHRLSVLAACNISPS
jgi:quinohemoprotein ethanol dehydrogenase